MSKAVVACLVGLFIVASPIAHAQDTAGSAQATTTQERLSDADFKALTDRRIEILKFALQLTPDQQKYWAALEEAIRSRATARHQRLVNLASQLSGQRNLSPVDIMRERANALATKSETLKKLADAWQPLYESLDDNQKARLRFLAVYLLREMRDAAESRRVQAEDEVYEVEEE